MPLEHQHDLVALFHAHAREHRGHPVGFFADIGKGELLRLAFGRMPDERALFRLIAADAVEHVIGKIEIFRRIDAEIAQKNVRKKLFKRLMYNEKY